jgi:beta-lactamase regulating signal transducer with metallopeptidase domain
LIGWLGAAHALGATVLLARWLLGHLGLWRLLRAGKPVPAEVAAVCRSLCAGRPVPRLLQSSRVRGPLSCGVFRPTVLLPASLCTRPQEAALRWVLAHELAHLARRDVCSCLLFGLGEIVFYALPWFWWLRRQAGLCREYLADAAAAQGGAAADYAQFLLNLTAAPPAPAGALGVTGHTSDLFRRVTMLLRSSGIVENRPPRLWSLGVAAGLLSLAALVAGVGLRADVARADEPAKKEEPKKDEPKKEQPDKKGDANKEQPKKEEPKKADDDFPDFEKLFQNIPAGMDPEQVKMMREQMKRMTEQMRRQAPAGGIRGGAGVFGGGGPGAGGNFFNPFGVDNHDGRLGALIKEPSPTLVDQLDLPKGQGVVIEDVTAGSPAAKAGLKANDILLELAGKPVSSNVAEVVKAIHGLKADKPVDAVVLRKGKKETIKGLSLPEAKAPEAGNAFGGFPGLPGGGLPFPQVGVAGRAGGINVGGVAGFPGMGGMGGFAGAGGVMTTVFRSGDSFTARHQEGNLVITVTGTVADGKATTKSINVQDGGKSEKYASVDKVPEEYRDKVKNLVEMGEKGAVKVEIK